MANSRSAKKRIRQAARRSDRNRVRRSRVRTHIRNVEEAIASGNKLAAEEAYKAAMPALHRSSQNGAFHRNTTRRKLSGLSRRINAM